jgi:type IX secretion system PorP/SprF family membrane protein
MIFKKVTYYLLLTTLFIGGPLHAQEEYIVNHSKFMQKSNPSYFGFNSLNKVGVLYNSMKLNEYDRLDNKYFFGALTFEDQGFSLGIDINSFKIQTTGLTSNLANLSYIYKLQFDNNTFFLPAVTVGFGSSSVNPANLIFEDQLDTSTGFINSESIDPLAPVISNVNYFDLGASFILHTDKYMAGLSFKHLNKPNTSYNKEVPFEKPIQVSLQGAYEFDLNPYERRFLPRYSYLYAYGSFTKYGDALQIYLSQDFQLGEFSIGLSQQAASLNSFSLNNVGVSIGLAVENFDFGILYNFPFQSPGIVYSPSIFELFITFDFSIYRRNKRGQYNRLTTDNYY